MKKILFSVFVITALVAFALPQISSAAMTWSTNFSTNGVIIGIDTFGAAGSNKPSAAVTFTPSGGVQMAGNVSADFLYFNIVAQHSGGDKSYGLHSNGGRMSYHAETPATFTTSGPGSATSDPATDFPTTGDWLGM